MKAIAKDFEDTTTVTRRMLAFGLISEIEEICVWLKDICDTLDSELSEEDAELSFDLYDKSISDSLKKLTDEKLYAEDQADNTSINMMVDYFPYNQKDYNFGAENADRLKTGMRTLCSDANVNSRDLAFAIQNGVTKIASFLAEIDRKKKNVEDYKYEGFWQDVKYREEDLYVKRAMNDYDAWKEEYNYKDMQTLTDKRSQEILRLLKADVFKKVHIVNRDIANRSIVITEEALEIGTQLPEGIENKCAQMSKFVTMNDDILSFNYKELGKYIYRNYADISEEELNALIYFDFILYQIHRDMVACNPNLAEYMDDYEDKVKEDIVNYGLRILEACNNYLDKKVGNDFFSAYLNDAANDNVVGMEVLRRLKRDSKKHKLIGNMIGMLKSNSKIFRTDVVSVDLASAISKVVEKPNRDSFKRYIDEGVSDHKSKLSQWTTRYINDKFGTKTEQIFLGIAKK